MLSCISSATVVGVCASLIEVEVDLSRGLFVFSVVGLPASSVSESRTRVKSALVNCGYGFPKGRVTVNLAPANIKKDGTAFDLPMALGIAAAQGLIPTQALDSTLVLGELSLDGRLRGVSGVMPIAAQAHRLGFNRLLVPSANLAEAAQVCSLHVEGAEHLAEVVEALNGGPPLNTEAPRPAIECPPPISSDMLDIKGQKAARRAAEVAAAGGHNLLMSGPPGTGKTMIARRLPSIVPKLTRAEMIESSSIASVAGLLHEKYPLVRYRPFRSPHHSISDVALIGGGVRSRPGEVSLAHNGVLFLDELPEFKRAALESLRQPLEDGEVVVSRAQQSVRYPARFMLVASMNPCPCGFLGHPRRPCDCHPTALRSYRSKMSGPLMDRFDIQVDLKPVSPKRLREVPLGERSEAIRQRVVRARQIQTTRYANMSISSNAAMSPNLVREYCRLDTDGGDLLCSALERLHLSARAHDRILKVARTIADLDECAEIETAHLGEAIQYRVLNTRPLS